jgi:hypothetical protein
MIFKLNKMLNAEGILFGVRRYFKIVDIAYVGNSENYILYFEISSLTCIFCVSPEISS